MDWVDPNRSDAESRSAVAFAEYLERLERGDGADFDEFCRERPELEESLRKLHSTWREVASSSTCIPAPKPGESVAHFLRREDGLGVDPTVFLDPREVTPSRDPSDERVQSLSARPPASGRYTLVEEIARGGMGVILRVWDEDIRRHLAMKVMLGTDGRPSSTPMIHRGVLKRFLEEAQITGQLNHPSIVPVHELGIDREGRVYFTMQLVKGRPLKTVIALAREDRDAWTKTRALGVILQVCEAMAYAHSRGVLHRDLKPSNVMVGKFGETYVMDWGLAKLAGRADTHDLRLRRHDEVSAAVSAVRTDRQDEMDRSPESPLVTMDGAVVGTPAYMPPEQAEGRVEEIGVRSDVYAIGAMLYHLLTGRPPYLRPGAKTSPYAILARVVDGPPTPVAEIDPEAPPELVAICEKAMARSPSDRYGSMSDMANDIRAFLEDRVVRAHRTGAVAEFRKWVVRNKGMAVALAATVVLALGLVFVVSRTLMQQQTIDEIREAQSIAEEESLRAERSEQAARQERDRAVLAGETAHRLRADAERESYKANLIAADWSLRAEEVVEARRCLDECDPGLRGWEWRHLLLRSDSSVMRIGDHPGAVTAVAPSPDGAWIVTGCVDGGVRLWHAGTGELLRMIGQFSGPVTTVAYSPDGTRIACGTTDRAVRIWRDDLRRWDPEFVVEMPPVFSVAFSPDGSRVAASDRRSVYVRDAVPGRGARVLTGHGQEVLALAWSPDGTQVVSASRDNTVRLWNAGSGDLIRSMVFSSLAGATVAFSPDGTEIAAGSDNRAVRIWSALDGRVLATLLGHEGAVRSVCFDRDGRRIVSASDDSRIRIWDRRTGETVRILRGHESAVTSVALSPDGTQILSCSLDGTVRTWDALAEGVVIPLEGHITAIRSVAFSPDGSRLVSGSMDRTLRIWDVDRREGVALLRGHESGVLAVAFDRDGRRIASSSENGTLRIWEASGGSLLDVVDASDAAIRGIAFSRDGSKLVLASGPSASVWDTATWAPLVDGPAHDAEVLSVAFSPDGSCVASASAAGAIHLWNAGSGASDGHLVGHDAGVVSLAFHPDGDLLASAASDGTVVVWATATGEALHHLVGHADWVSSIRFSPCGTRIVSGSLDRTLRIWDVATGERLIAIHGHAEGVSAVAFSDDGSRLVSGGLDGELVLWETTPTLDTYRLRRSDAFAADAARFLVDGLLQRTMLVDEVIAWLESNGEIDRRVKDAGIRIAGFLGDDPIRLMNGSQPVVRSSGRSRAEYASAARRIEAAFRLLQDDPEILTALGIARYRVGEDRSAIETLHRARNLRGESTPLDLGFLAMAYRRLGLDREARIMRDRLEGMMQSPVYSQEAVYAEVREEVAALSDW